MTTAVTLDAPLRAGDTLTRNTTNDAHALTCHRLVERR